MKHKQFLRLALVVAISALMLAACGGEKAVDPLDIGDPELGKELFVDYQAVRCETCHSLDGSEYREGPTLLGISERAGERIPELSAVEYLRQSIVDPEAFILRGYESGVMPPFYEERLSDEDINNLVAFLLTQ